MPTLAQLDSHIRFFGSVIGTAVGGVAGGVMGNMAGGMLQLLVAGSSPLARTAVLLVNTVVRDLTGKSIEKGSHDWLQRVAPGERERMNHDLQTAFRDALREALYDIGGSHTFADQWRRGRDVAEPATFPFRQLYADAPALAAQLSAALQGMVAAVGDESLLPLNPPQGQPAASVSTYLLSETPEALVGAYFDQVIAPWLAGSPHGPALREARALGYDLVAHLRRHLLERQLIHLGEMLKGRTEAWRAFNRLMLEELRAGIKAVDARSAGLAAEQMAEWRAAQEQMVGQLDGLLAHSEAWSASVAELMVAVGKVEKRLDEQFDAFLGRVVNQHREVLDTIGRLMDTAGRIEFKVNLMLQYLQYSGVVEPAERLIAGADQPPAPGEPPFKGLHYFEEADRALFYGREALVARLVTRLQSDSFLAIVGASGSGKSSLLRAGLVPSLRAQGWAIEIITPSASVARGLAPPLPPAPSPNGEPGDAPVAGRQPSILIVDQFEELFTIVRDEQRRRDFIDQTLSAAGENHRVVISLRADFYGHCASYYPLRELMAAHQEYLGPLSASELRRTIEEPARQGGWELERGLVEILLRDVGDEPGALPLLSHALLETWEARRGHYLTLDSYAESGGVHGAIAQTADHHPPPLPAPDPPRRRQ
jgi:hypothetical protein